MLKFISVGFFLLFSFAAQAAGNILVVGDSISAGYGLGQGQSWPSLLDKRLREARLDYSVVNASISGDTTAGGRSRIGAALDQANPSSSSSRWAATTVCAACRSAPCATT